MIVKFENFEKNLIDFKTSKLFLFHGSNFGKVDDCAKHTIDLNKEEHELEVINFYLDEIKKGQLSQIFHEKSAPNIFCSNTLLCFNLSNEKLSKELVSNISNINLDNILIIIKSDQLSPKSNVRFFFESSKTAISVPCYEESKLEKITFVRKYLKSANIHPTQSEIIVLCEHLSSQRLEIKNELEKIIILHKNLKGQKSVDFMLSYLSESLVNDQTAFIFSLASKYTKDFVKNYNRFTDFGSENIKLVSFLLEHFFRLLSVKKKVSEGLDIKQSIRQLKPPVFFKNISMFEEQIINLSANELEAIIKKLYICKKELISGSWSSSFFLLFNLLQFLGSRSSPQNV